MARFVLRDSIPSKILLIAVCVLASVCTQPPVATAQRVGGGVHPVRGARTAPRRVWSFHQLHAQRFRSLGLSRVRA